MGKGSNGSNTVVQQSGPPPEFLAAYQNAVQRAQDVANTPAQTYGGNLVAGFSPDQLAGMGGIEQSYGIAAPYINSAADYINAATAPVLPTAQPYIDQARGIYGSAGTPFDVTQFSGDAVGQYENPFTSDVIDATQALFNEQNAQAANRLRGNAVSAGAMGGDREAVAQGVLAGQQQLTQAPVLAGLRQQNYQQALDEFNKQQQVRLQAQQAARQLGLGGAQGIAGLGAQALGAEEANRWLSSQAGYGMANLGNQALSTSLTGANALLGIGGLQQQQAQQVLNAPYAQWLAQQAYPFQTAGWLANIAEGLGGASGGTSSTTSPGPSVGSQVLGAGLAGAGLLGQTGAFGSNGWLSGMFDSGVGSAAGAAGSGFLDSGAWDLAAARGGRVPRRAVGGGMGSEPWAASVPAPWDAPGPVPMGGHPGGHPLILGNYGSTSNTSGGGSGANDAMTAIKDVAQIAGIVAMFLKNGGKVPHRASGGDISVSVQPGVGGHGVPHLSVTPLDLSQGMGSVNPEASRFSQAVSAPGNSRLQNYLTDTLNSASFVPPQTWQPPPPGAPSTAPASTNDLGSMLINALAGLESGGGNDGAGISADAAAAAAGGMDVGSAHDTGQTELAAGASGGLDFGGSGLSGGDISGGMGGLYARGGALQNGGDPDDLDDDAEPALYATDTEAPLSAVDKLALLGAQADGEEPPRYSVGAVDQSGPPAPPPAMGQSAGMGSIAGRGEPVQPTRGDPWRALTYAGLGILGGSSPNAGVNIGRGALAGMKEYETEENRRQRASSLANYRQSQAEAARARTEEATRHNTMTEKQRAQQLADHAEEVAKRLGIAGGHLGVAEGRLEEERRYHDEQLNQGQWVAGTGKDADGNDVPGMYHLPKGGGEPVFHPGVKSAQSQRIEQGQTRLEQGQAKIDQAAQRLQQSQEAATLRNQLIREGHDAAAANSLIGDASRMIASGMVKQKDLPTVVEQLRQERQRLVSPSGAPSAATAPAAPAARPLPPGLPPGARYAPDGNIYVPKPGGGWLRAVPASPGS